MDAAPRVAGKQKMKANRKFVQEDEAVSPVIAVILMVAITVVLAATVFVLVSDIGGNQKTGPTTNLQVTADAAANTILIKHTSGDKLKTDEYKVSVTSGASSNPTYVTCGFELSAGGQITASTLSTGASAACTGNNVASGDALTDGTFRVVVVHIPSEKVLLDRSIDCNCA
jgi:archaeal type IV pilus assembly protein PilA